MTVHERVAAARARLRAAGISRDSAALDARLLAQFVLGWDAARYTARANDLEPADFGARYEALVARRAAREPLAYIVGTREFWGLDFEVSNAVLIPRPETELIVEAALNRFDQPDAVISAADVGTGSGCIAVALASERREWRIIATDMSERALEVARRNAQRHAVADRITFVNADLLDRSTQAFDLIVANPPYVRGGERPAMQQEVRDHEPSIALFAGDDGLAVIRRLLSAAALRLKPGGTLIFEFGFGQEIAIPELIAHVPALQLHAVTTDLQGIPRVAVVTRT